MLSYLLLNVISGQVPEPKQVTLFPPERWSIQQVAKPSLESDRDPAKPITLKVKGRRVTFRRGDADWIFATLGSDGSVLVQRSSRQIVWGDQFSIWFQGKERNLPYGVGFYRDRQNYIGVNVEASAAPVPETPPSSFVLLNGKKTPLGPGAVVHWGDGGVFVLHNSIDERGNPTGQAFAVGEGLRVVYPGGEAKFDGWNFVGAHRDGTLVLERNGGQVLRWRAGRAVDHWKLPNGWSAIGVAKGGWILTRKGGGPEGEEIWEMGILRDGRLSPLRFSRPKGSEKLLWRHGDELFGNQAFRIHAFYGEVDKWYRLSSS